MWEVTKKLQPENHTTQTVIEHTPQPIENNEGVIYDTELENTLKKMTNNTGFFSNIWRPKTWFDVERLSC